jgi:hypothetical protein
VERFYTGLLVTFGLYSAHLRPVSSANSLLLRHLLCPYSGYNVNEEITNEVNKT